MLKDTTIIINTDQNLSVRKMYRRKNPALRLDFGKKYASALLFEMMMSRKSASLKAKKRNFQLEDLSNTGDIKIRIIKNKFEQALKLPENILAQLSKYYREIHGRAQFD